jgi:hypothetical protein
MKSITFLDKLSTVLLAQPENELSSCTIILPNKRAKVFLLESIKKQLEGTAFAPTIISIEDFIQEISGLRSIDPIELLFEFYEVYLSVTEKSKQQTFDEFATWAKTALQDFNEIDRYLLEPNKVFSYLEAIEALKRWQVEASKTTTLIDNHLEFWAKLPLYYQSFYDHLISKGIGYQGLLYREAVKNLEKFAANTTNTIYFAGFNALNQAEEKIIKYLANEKKAKIFWDIDELFLNDSYHDAGLFIRKFKKEWKPFINQDFEWIVNHFTEEKNIEIIGTPKSIGQAKIVGTIIEKIQSKSPNLENTAVVLGDENLLLPVLFGLPASVEALNITMGYPSKNNPAQLLISKLFKLHTNAKQRNEKSYTFYYKEVLAILNHPLIEPYCKVEEVVNVINSNNFTFFSREKLFSLYAEKYPNSSNILFELLFARWVDVSEILANLNAILLHLKTQLNNDNSEEKVAKTFLYSIYKTIVKLTNYHEKYNQIESISALHAIYKQIIELAEVSFEGEPLSGLQVMGVLESRVLDFENVIITSVNEGKFPAGKSQNSFIPYDVKKELGLPTYKEKDAIYCYHFYHLLLRAKNIWLLYNTDNEGIDAGEKSRFITQLEIERQPNHNITSTIYNAVLPEKAYEPISIPKTDKIITRLHEIATDKGFSPSSLTNYIRNPMQFYMQRILRINEAEDVEENIAANTLGTIIHNALEELYTPYLNQFLALHHIESMESKIDVVILKYFKQEFKEGEITKGKNLLAFEVAKRNVYNFLQVEKKAIIEDNDAIKVLLLEESLSCEIHLESFDFPIKIAGKVDRIEERNGVIRIIDYKTGRVDAGSLKLNDILSLTPEIENEKIIQLLCYAMMFENHELRKNLDITAGIISFKNMKKGFLPLVIGTGKEAVHVISNEMIEDFKVIIKLLILEIFNPEIPFKEKI